MGRPLLKLKNHWAISDTLYSCIAYYIKMLSHVFANISNYYPQYACGDASLMAKL